MVKKTLLGDTDRYVNVYLLKRGEERERKEREKKGGGKERKRRGRSESTAMHARHLYSMLSLLLPNNLL